MKSTRGDLDCFPGSFPCFLAAFVAAVPARFSVFGSPGRFSSSWCVSLQLLVTAHGGLAALLQRLHCLCAFPSHFPASFRESSHRELPASLLGLVQGRRHEVHRCFGEIINESEERMVHAFLTSSHRVSPFVARTVRRGSCPFVLSVSASWVLVPCRGGRP